MARRPFDPASLGLENTEYRQGDVLDRAAVDALAAEADVLVHLAFIIMGGRDETREVNLTGSRNVFAAARRREAARLHVVGRRLRLPRRQPAAADRGRAAARQRGVLLLGPEGRARARAGGGDRGRRRRGVRAAAVHRRRAGRAGAAARAPAEPAPGAERSRSCPTRASPFQLVHHDDVATRARGRDARARARPGSTTWPATGRSRSATSPARSAGSRSRCRDRGARRVARRQAPAGAADQPSGSSPAACRW